MSLEGWRTNYTLQTGQSVRVRIDDEAAPFGKMIPGKAFAEVMGAISRDNLSTAGL